MDFKKTLLIFCLFVGFNTVAQNRLEFNRVLDTIITVNTGGFNSYVSVSPKYIGETLSPAAGKVWKINNIELGNLNTAGTSAASNYGMNVVAKLFAGVDIYDGINDITIIAEGVFENGSYLYRVPEIGKPNQVEFPLWINSSSSLRAILLTKQSGQTVANLVIKTYISLIEFNVVTD